MFGISAALGLGACSKAPPPAPAPQFVSDTVYVVDSVQVEVEAAQDEALEREVAELRIHLLERDALLAELRAQLANERQEVLRNMAKLQSQASRAEAASELAEAQLAVDGVADLSDRVAGGVARDAEGLLEDAKVQFNQGNFGQALYLATGARTMVGAIGARQGSLSGREPESGERPFALAVPLAARVQSNVRSGPGTSHTVVFVTPPGSRLEGIAYTSEWILVRNASGQEGWIYHELVIQ